MRKNIRILFTCICLLSLHNQSKAQGTLIHYWHFNNLTGTFNLPNIPGIDADYSIIDTAKAKILFAKWPGTFFDSSYLDGYTTVTADYDTVNLKMGASAGTALRTRNPTDSMELLFYIPTTGYQNIVLKYGCEKSSNGMATQLFDYSTDSGATWKTSGLPVTSFANTTTFSLINIAFTDAAVNNNAKLVFRIKFSGNTVSTSGNNRFDNISVEGTPTTGVAGLSMNDQLYSLYPNPVGNTLNISTTNPGKQSVMVYDATGRSILTTNVAGTHFSVNVSVLNAGYYIINITDLATGKINTTKFIKQ